MVSAERKNAVKPKPLPKQAYQHILQGMRSNINRLKPYSGRNTIWGNYEENNTYDENETELKRRTVIQFAAEYSPHLAWDLGCNTGFFSAALLAGGCHTVVGYDVDFGALEGAFRRAIDKGLNFLPLYMDAVNPSPSQGWLEKERKGWNARCNADVIIALAFIHHLAIARNIPLDQLVKWLVSLAPAGLIEFVPKQDPMVQSLLRNRPDIFPDYCEENFVNLLSKYAKPGAKVIVSESGRALYHYSR